MIADSGGAADQLTIRGYKGEHNDKDSRDKGLHAGVHALQVVQPKSEGDEFQNYDLGTDKCTNGGCSLFL